MQASHKWTAIVIACFGMTVLGRIAYSYSSPSLAASAATLSPQNPSSVTVSTDKWFSLNIPPNPTEAQTKNLMKALVHGLPLPSGYSEVEDHGKVTVVATGALTASKWQAVITLEEDLGDISEARFYLNSALKKVATYQNGAIEDDGASSFAAHTMMLPQAPPYDVRVEWDVPGVSVMYTRTLQF